MIGGSHGRLGAIWLLVPLGLAVADRDRSARRVQPRLAGRPPGRPPRSPGALEGAAAATAADATSRRALYRAASASSTTSAGSALRSRARSGAATGRARRAPRPARRAGLPAIGRNAAGGAARIEAAREHVGGGPQPDRSDAGRDQRRPAGRVVDRARCGCDHARLRSLERPEQVPAPRARASPPLRARRRARARSSRAHARSPRRCRRRAGRAPRPARAPRSSFRFPSGRPARRGEPWLYSCGRRATGGGQMDDGQIHGTIEQLVAEEHELWEREASGNATDADRSRLEEVKISLDQCWDLLRQRRALREAGSTRKRRRLGPRRWSSTTGRTGRTLAAVYTDSGLGGWVGTRGRLLRLAARRRRGAARPDGTGRSAAAPALRGPAVDATAVPRRRAVARDARA